MHINKCYYTYLLTMEMVIHYVDRMDDMYLKVNLYNQKQISDEFFSIMKFHVTKLV